MNLKLNKYQVYALLIPIVPFVGIGISALTDGYRFSIKYHWIYSTGKMFCCCFWLISFMWAIINGIYVINNLKLKVKYKLMWLIINYAAFIWILIMTTILILE